MLAIGNGQDLDVVKLNTYAYLDNEIGDQGDQSQWPARSRWSAACSTQCRHRTPHPRASGSPMPLKRWSRSNTSPASLQVKMLPATGLGRLAESAATADSHTFAGRMIRPYPPGMSG